MDGNDRGAAIARGGESRIQCSGVVIACSGNKHTGYHVSMVFTGLSKQAQARLNSMAYSDLGAG